MKRKIFLFGFALALLVGCTDDPPIVIIVPPQETPVTLIDNYYYAQFGWGKPSNKDTVTIEVPDDTLGSDTVPFVWDVKRDFMLSAFEMRNEKIIDTTNAEEEDVHLAWGYHYAPAAYFYNRGLYEYLRDANDPVSFENYLLGEEYDEDKDEERLVYQDVFGVAFPWNIKGDTLPFWDIQDYLDHPKIVKGPVNWGRVGNNKVQDTLWNNDAYTGVVISYVDNDNVEWRTDNPPTFQDGSYFLITDKRINQRDGLTYYIITGEFAANLYNSNGEYKQAKGGKFRLRILTDIELGEQPE